MQRVNCIFELEKASWLRHTGVLSPGSVVASSNTNTKALTKGYARTDGRAEATGKRYNVHRNNGADKALSSHVRVHVRPAMPT